MNFNVSQIAPSLARYLSAEFPGVTFYSNPNQQGTNCPCMFLQTRYSQTKLQTGGRWLRTIGLDLTYLEDYNLPNLQEIYEAAAEKLDVLLETFPFYDVNGNENVKIRTYNREYNIDLDAMHYKFDLKVWVSLPSYGTPMQELELNEVVTLESGE